VRIGLPDVTRAKLVGRGGLALEELAATQLAGRLDHSSPENFATSPLMDTVTRTW
jgi:hypothetical protein